MKNVLILGSGRSGTSMVAGTLARAGYFMGENLYPGRESNPMGFFEDPEINGINELILERVVPGRPRFFGRWFFHDRPLQWQRWLARVRVGTNIPCIPEVSDRIRRIVRREPYCFKDPRFSYTLPVWRPFLRNTVFVCVFRDPASTASSILKECRAAPYLQALHISFDQAVQVWMMMYQHILEVHRHEGGWLFLHYDQALQEEGISRLEGFVRTKVDRSFPTASLHRSFPERTVPKNAVRVYGQLCELAQYNLKKSSAGRE